MERKIRKDLTEIWWNIDEEKNTNEVWFSKERKLLIWIELKWRLNQEWSNSQALTLIFRPLLVTVTILCLRNWMICVQPSSFLVRASSKLMASMDTSHSDLTPFWNRLKILISGDIITVVKECIFLTLPMLLPVYLFWLAGSISEYAIYQHLNCSANSNEFAYFVRKSIYKILTTEQLSIEPSKSA